MPPEPITHIDVPEDPQAPEASSPEPVITMAELADSGLAAGEVEMAKKHGLVPATPEAEAEAKKKAEEAAASAARAAAQTPANPEVGADGKPVKPAVTPGSVDERFRILSAGKSPEQVISEISEKGELNKDQEAVLVASLTRNGQAMYWAQKKERQKRAAAEKARVDEVAAKQKEIDDLKAQLAARKPVVQKMDEFGNPIAETDEERAAREAAEAAAIVDPKKKPLTLEDLERIEKEKEAKAQEEERLRTERKQQLLEALNFQQEDAKNRYDNFDAATERVKEILTAANSNSLDKIFPDPTARARVFKKCQDLLIAYAKADQFEPGDYNAADMTYELAQEHPEFGQEQTPPKKSETGADGTPETAARVVTNANRRGSSATLTGGGSRRIPLGELTQEQARRVPTKNWNQIPKSQRDALLGKV